MSNTSILTPIRQKSILSCLSTDIINIISKYCDYCDLDFDIPFFEKHLDKVNWLSLSANINIPLSFFEKHLDKVNWSFFIIQIQIYQYHFLKNI